MKRRASGGTRFRRLLFDFAEDCNHFRFLFAGEEICWSEKPNFFFVFTRERERERELPFFGFSLLSGFMGISTILEVPNK